MSDWTLRSDLQAFFGITLPESFSLDRWAVSLRDKPAQNNALTVGIASVLFYLAERGRNPKVNDIYDAMIYTSTCLSVGYGDIFAKTPVGKIIGTLLMTAGPALSGSALDGARGSADATEVQDQILRTLQEILDQLRFQSDAAR